MKHVLTRSLHLKLIAFSLALLLPCLDASAVSATGGTESTLPGYQLHTFTATGSNAFVVTHSGYVEVLLIGGGGGGGNTIAGGGGGGGFIASNNFFVVAGSNYTVQVGAGGIGSPTSEGYAAASMGGRRGENSSFSGLVAYGGGGGRNHSSVLPNPYVAVGSGGGMGAGSTKGPCLGTDGQGHAGGVKGTGGDFGAGGGGAGAVGENGLAAPGAAGGAGLPSSITGTEKFYAGGGGGGTRNSTFGLGGLGGLGGGGGGSNYVGIAGTANTGGGGGGGGFQAGVQAGGDGGSGIVVIRYLSADSLTITGSPENYGSPTPPYGQTNELENGDTFLCSVPTGWVTVTSDTRVSCSGYQLFTNDVLAAVSATNEFNYTHVAAGRLIWQWQTQHLLTIETTAGGTVSSVGGWLDQAASTNVTATPSSGYSFWMWQGDVPEGGAFSASLTLPADHPRTVTAYFKKDNLEEKVYVGANDGLWTDGANWLPEGEPSPANAVFIPANTIVKIPAIALVGSLTISNAAIVSINGETTPLLARNAADTTRTDPVGLLLAEDLTLLGSGGLAIGGYDQQCSSYLEVDGNLTLSGSAKLAIYAGKDTATTWQEFQTGGAQVVVAGNTTLADTSVIYPYCNRKSGLGVIFNLQNLDIAVGAAIDATGLGHSLVGSTYYGLGVDTGASNKGGSYGGLGGNASTTKTNGFLFAPFRPGSPGYYSSTTMGMGGGAIRILASTVSLNGKLLAEGKNFNGHTTGAGSGGGIWVTCSNFIAGASAVVSAKGGDNTQQGNAGGGGGGRIAIMTDRPSQVQLDSLYSSGTCINMAIVTTDMADPVLSPYPTLVNIAGGLNKDNWSRQPYVSHGKPGTAVWLRNKGANHQVVVSDDYLVMSPTPGYGTSLLPDGLATFSVVSPSVVSLPNGLSRMTCTGYAWSNAVGVTASGSEASFSVDMTNDIWVTWSWGNLEYPVAVRSGGKGSVTLDYSDWYASGASCALTAVPDAGCSFLYWVGDVPHADRLNSVLTLTMDRPRSVTACFTAASARDLVWTGDVSNDWFNSNNWDHVAIPGVNDRVVIASGTSSVLLPADIRVASLTLADTAKLFMGGTGSVATALLPINPIDNRPYSLTVSGNLTISNSAALALGGLNATSSVNLAVGGNLSLTNTAALAVYAGYKGPSTDVATYQIGGAGVTVGGTTTVGAGCWIHPFCHQISGAPVLFDLQNLFVAANAGFNADYRGFGRLTTIEANGNWVLQNYGPGRVVTRVPIYNKKFGGSYGGLGGGNAPSSVYGYTNAPFFPGSPNFEATLDFYTLWAGGAIRIQAKQVQLNGQLNAQGHGNRNYEGGCSGGGIWVTCDSFSVGPGAMMNANGGNAYRYGNNAGGGGGRIAIALKLVPKQILALYASGTARDLSVQEMAASPYATNFSVAGGTPWGTGEAGGVGSAVFIVSTVQAGTVIILR